MLLPALSQARKKARSIACTSNLKTFGLAITLYCNDSDGWAPSNEDKNNGIYWGTNGLFRTMLGEKNDGTDFFMNSILCPSSVARPRPGTNYGGVSGNRKQPNKSYAMVYHDQSKKDQPWYHHNTYRIDDIADPSRAYLFLDAGVELITWINFSNVNNLLTMDDTSNLSVCFRHSKSFNVVHWSGNVSNKKASDITMNEVKYRVTNLTRAKGWNHDE